jgi:type II secretory pathway component PulJ
MTPDPTLAAALEAHAEDHDALELHRDQAEGYNRALNALRADLREATERARLAVEHDTATSRLLGRAQAILDAAGVPTTNAPAQGEPPVEVRNLQVHERVEALAAQLRHTEGALDRVEEERAEAVALLMAVEDREVRLLDRCRRLELYALQLVDRVTAPRERI